MARKQKTESIVVEMENKESIVEEVVQSEKPFVQEISCPAPQAVPVFNTDKYKLISFRKVKGKVKQETLLVGAREECLVARKRLDMRLLSGSVIDKNVRYCIRRVPGKVK